ncbi:putative F-box protein At1g23770 [Mangifera indica]|uniref:putative F-box protein At1g23770 n=1 Tax=Mangifera indica TaxID=29780 RepID=UPI001CFA6599|nr:putative F-box protein At1g23770 [Mangifera indica]
MCNWAASMSNCNPIQEPNLVSSDTDDCEALSSDDESVSPTMEINNLVSPPPKLPPVFSFMEKVFMEEVGSLSDNFKLLIMGIHVIMLQSGFVCFDSDSGNKIDGFRLPTNWDDKASSTRYLCYTLPQLLELGFIAVERVVLRFQNSEDSVSIFGALAVRDSVEQHQLILNQNRFVDPLLWAFACRRIIERRIKIDATSSEQYPENEIFEFHKLVDDALVHPLLSDLHEGTGLLLPPCFMGLPVEIKIKIVGLLDGDYIARVACVCSELRNLTSEDDLRRKYMQAFRRSGTFPGMSNWKESYGFSKMKHPYRFGREEYDIENWTRQEYVLEQTLIWNEISW